MPRARLREDVFPARGRSKTETATMLGISRQHFYDILRECRPVSPVIAVRLDKPFGDRAGAWRGMQAARGTWQAERREDVSGIAKIRAKAA